jgi:hypothetical protein
MAFFLALLALVKYAHLGEAQTAALGLTAVSVGLDALFMATWLWSGYLQYFSLRIESKWNSATRDFELSVVDALGKAVPFDGVFGNTFVVHFTHMAAMPLPEVDVENVAASKDASDIQWGARIRSFNMHDQTTVSDLKLKKADLPPPPSARASDPPYAHALEVARPTILLPTYTYSYRHSRSEGLTPLYLDRRTGKLAVADLLRKPMAEKDAIRIRRSERQCCHCCDRLRAPTVLALRLDLLEESKAAHEHAPACLPPSLHEGQQIVVQLERSSFWKADNGPSVRGVVVTYQPSNPQQMAHTNARLTAVEAVIGQLGSGMHVPKGWKHPNAAVVVAGDLELGDVLCTDPSRRRSTFMEHEE